MQHFLRGLLVPGLISLFSVWSCKNPQDIGLSPLPGEDTLSGFVTDTFTINTSSILVDSLRTDGIGRNSVGDFRDPEFGTTTAAFSCNLRLPANNLDLGINLSVDSLVLLLDWDEFYGDTSAFFELQVLELHEALPEVGDTLFNNRRFETRAAPIGSKFFKPRPSDSVEIQNLDPEATDSLKTLAPHLRIKLYPTVTQRFIDASGTNQFKDNASFQEFFKGLTVRANTTSTTGEGGMLFFNLTSTLSNLTLYYHADSVAMQTTFLINSQSLRHNYFSHDYSGSPAQNLLDDPSVGRMRFMVQPTVGLRGLIHMPGLHNLDHQGPVIIHRAKLVLPVETGSDSRYSLPSRLILTELTADNRLLVLRDRLISDVRYGGFYDGQQRAYEFDISVFAQGVQDSLVSPPLILSVSGEAVNANRAILNGPEAGDRIKLEITYTPLP